MKCSVWKYVTITKSRRQTFCYNHSAALLTIQSQLVFDANTEHQIAARIVINPLFVSFLQKSLCFKVQYLLLLKYYIIQVGYKDFLFL